MKLIQKQIEILYCLISVLDIRNYVKKIVEWTVNYAKENKKLFVRLDTHSGNERINEYYISCGFTYKGISEIEWTADLPEHYKEGSFSLFEIKI